MVQEDSFSQAMREVMDQQMREAQKEQTNELRKISSATGDMATAIRGGSTSGAAYNASPGYSMYSPSAMGSAQSGGYYNYINQNIATPYETQSTFKRATRSLDLMFGVGNDRVSYEDKLMASHRAGTDMSRTATGALPLAAGIGVGLFNPIAGAVVGIGAGIGVGEAMKSRDYQDYLFQNSFKYINYAESNNPQTGTGFNRSERGQLGKFLKNANTDFFLSDEETKKMLEGFTDAGLLRTVSDMDSFKKKFKSLISATKSSALTLKATYDETVQMMGEMQKLGMSTGKVGSFAAMSKVNAVNMGIEASEQFKDILSMTAQQVSGTGLTQDTQFRNLSLSANTAQAIYDKLEANKANLTAAETQTLAQIKNVGGTNAFAQTMYNSQLGGLTSNAANLLPYMKYNEKTGSFEVDPSKLTAYSDMNMSNFSSRLTDFKTGLVSQLGQEGANAALAKFEENKTNIIGNFGIEDQTKLFKNLVNSFGTNGMSYEEKLTRMSGVSQTDKMALSEILKYYDQAGGVDKSSADYQFQARMTENIDRINSQSVSIWQRITTNMEKVLQDNAFVDAVTTFSDGIANFGEDLTNFINGIDATLGKGLKGIEVSKNFNLESESSRNAAKTSNIETFIPGMSQYSYNELEKIKQGNNVVGADAYRKPGFIEGLSGYWTNSLYDSMNGWTRIDANINPNTEVGKRRAAEKKASEVMTGSVKEKLGYMQEMIAGASLLESAVTGRNMDLDTSKLNLGVGLTGGYITAEEISKSDATGLMKKVQSSSEISAMSNTLTEGILKQYRGKSDKELDAMVKELGLGSDSRFSNWKDYDKMSGGSQKDKDQLIFTLIEQFSKEKETKTTKDTVSSRAKDEISANLSRETDLLTAFIDESTKRQDALARATNVQSSSGGLYTM
jgi:hypothetical protein